MYFSKQDLDLRELRHPQFLADNGFILYVGTKENKSGDGQGKVFFSLDDIPLDQRFLTERGNCLRRINEYEIKFVTWEGDPLMIKIKDKPLPGTPLSPSQEISPSSLSKSTDNILRSSSSDNSLKSSSDNSLRSSNG